MIQVARATALLLAAFAVAVPAQAKECKEALKDAKAMAIKVRITTSLGPFVLELNREKAPISTENFAAYVDSGHYNGTIFHRIIDGFMIQGGGFSKDGVQKQTRAPIKNESQNGLKNDPYTVAMARTQVRDSATSQFFINVVSNDRLNYGDELNPGYAVFGKVAEGKDVVDKLRTVQVNRPGTLSEAQPVTPVVLEKAECL